MPQEKMHDQTHFMGKYLLSTKQASNNAVRLPLITAISWIADYLGCKALTMMRSKPFEQNYIKGR